MPTLNLYTNVPVDAVTATDILKDATKAVAKILGKPESVHTHTLLTFFFIFSSLFHSFVFMNYLRFLSLLVLQLLSACTRLGMFVFVL